jgi:WD40 repeat protein
MRPNLAVLISRSRIDAKASGQTAREEKTISLPAGVSIEAAPAVSGNGNLCAAICSDRVLRIWSAHSGELVHTIDADRAVTVQFSGDGRLMAVAYEIVPYERGTIKVFDTNSWGLKHDLTAPFSMYVLAFSPENRRLAFSDLYTQIWDLTNGKSLTDISPPFGGSPSLSFSPDGKWLATADSDGFVRVYDAQTGALRSATKDLLLEPMAVSFSPDNKWLFAGGVDKSISTIDAGNGKVLRVLAKQPGVVWSLVVSADGKKAAAIYRSAERFNDINHLTLLDLANGTAVADFYKPGAMIGGGAFVGDHYLFTALSNSQITIWSLR